MEAHEKTSLDRIVAKVKLYVTTLLIIGSLGSAITTWLVFVTTSGVRAEVAALKNQTAADSQRFDRMADIVELAVVALVEPVGSPERERAIQELRERRRVTR